MNADQRRALIEPYHRLWEARVTRFGAVLDGSVPEVARQVVDTHHRGCVAAQGGWGQIQDELRWLMKWAMPTGMAYSAMQSSTFRDLVQVKGENLLSDALAGGRGVLIVAPHLGAPLVVEHHLASTGVEVSAFARVWSRDYQERANSLQPTRAVRVLPVHLATAAVDALATLRRGGAVVWQPDVSGPKKGPEHTLLGARISPGPFPAIAKRIGVPVLFATVRVRPTFEVRVSYAPVSTVAEGRGVLLPDILAQTERAILSALPQWTRWPLYPHL